MTEPSTVASRDHPTEVVAEVTSVVHPGESFRCLLTLILVGMLHTLGLWCHALSVWKFDDGGRITQESRQELAAYAVWGASSVALVVSALNYAWYVVQSMPRLTDDPSFRIRIRLAPVSIVVALTVVAFFAFFSIGAGRNITHVPGWAYFVANTVSAAAILAVLASRWALDRGVAGTLSISAAKRELRRLLTVETIWYLTGLAQAAALLRLLAKTPALSQYFEGAEWTKLAIALGGLMTLLLCTSYYVPYSRLEVVTARPEQGASLAGVAQRGGDLLKVMSPLLGALLAHSLS